MGWEMGDKGVENRLISQSLGMWCGVWGACEVVPSVPQVNTLGVTCFMHYVI